MHRTWYTLTRVPVCTRCTRAVEKIFGISRDMIHVLLVHGVRCCNLDAWYVPDPCTWITHLKDFRAGKLQTFGKELILFVSGELLTCDIMQQTGVLMQKVAEIGRLYSRSPLKKNY